MKKDYSNLKISFIEKAILAEEIQLPKINTLPISFDDLKAGKKIVTADMVYKDTKGKFFLNILTPLVDKVETNDYNKTGISTRNHIGRLQTSSYSSTNYITLTIPKYILLNFINTIPKGTEFIVTSIGGGTYVEDMKIIGIC